MKVSFEGAPVVNRKGAQGQYEVPAYWSWALFLVQRAHEHLLHKSPLLDASRRAVDFEPPPVPEDGAIHSLYVDNVLVEGHEPGEVQRVREASAAPAGKSTYVHDKYPGAYKKGFSKCSNTLTVPPVR